MTKKTSPAYRASKEETIPINKLHPFLKIICRKQDFMWQNLIIVIADEVSAMIDHAMKEIHAAVLLYYYREISNLLFVSINGTI